MADTKAQEPKVVGAADPGATPRGEEPKVAPDPAAPPKGKEPKPKKPKKGPVGEARPAEPEGPPPEPAPPPRLHEYYDQRVRPKLAQQFGFKNAHEIPKLVKIVLNVGMGDAPKNPKGLEAAVARSEEHTSELQSRLHLVCRLLLEKKKKHAFLRAITRVSHLTYA